MSRSGSWDRFRGRVSEEADRFADRFERVVDGAVGHVEEEADRFADRVEGVIGDIINDGDRLGRRIQDNVWDPIKDEIDKYRRPWRNVPEDREPYSHTGQPVRHSFYFDGTSLSAGDNSNISLMHQATNGRGADGMAQNPQYFEGPGAGSSNDLSSAFNFVSGNDGTEIMMQAYKHLCRSYQPGDELDLVGFSRGGGIAASFNNLVYTAGIVNPEGLTEEQFNDACEKAFETYFDNRNSPDSPEAVAFREEHSFYTRPTTDVVLFDPVDKMPFSDHNFQPNPNTANFSVALSIDETRDDFKPIKFHPDPNSNINFNQTYFVGDHSAVGGGTPKFEGLSDITGQWATDIMASSGVGFDPDKVDRFFGDANSRAVPTENFRPDGQDLWDSLGTTPREIPEGANIHSSVYERMAQVAGYNPGNISPTKLASYKQETIDVINNAKTMSAQEVTMA